MSIRIVGEKDTLKGFGRWLRFLEMPLDAGLTEQYCL
jgi:hypothetical protein